MLQHSHVGVGKAGRNDGVRGTAAVGGGGRSARACGRALWLALALGGVGVVSLVTLARICWVCGNACAYFESSLSSGMPTESAELST